MGYHDVFDRGDSGSFVMLFSVNCSYTAFQNRKKDGSGFGSRHF